MAQVEVQKKPLSLSRHALIYRKKMEDPEFRQSEYQRVAKYCKDRYNDPDPERREAFRQTKIAYSKAYYYRKKAEREAAAAAAAILKASEE